MGKTSKWLRNFLTGKKDKEKEKSPSNQIFSTSSEYPATPISIRHNPKEKKRWSFRRSSAAAAVSVSSSDSFPFPLEMVSTIMPVAQAAMDVNYGENKKQGLAMAAAKAAMDMDCEVKRQAVAMVVVKAAAADAAVAAATRLTEVAYVKATAFEEAAAIKIQSVFRSYLARKALRALRGLVKLQALARGHLVRKQAKATLRCMQALITAQARARAQRIRMIEATNSLSYQRQPFLVEPVNEDHFGYANHVAEENIKIVEMDHGEYKRGSKNRTIYVADQQHEDRYPTSHVFATHQVPSSLTNINRRGCSGHFEDYSISTVQSSPQDYLAKSKPDPSKSSPICFPTSECMQSLSLEYPMFPSYMANTESSRAKARSQSAPKTRPESFERQPSRRKASTEGKNIPKAMQIQRLSSLMGCAAQDLQYPLLMKLDKSTSSLNNSECGSTSTVFTNTNYRSLVTCEGNGNRYY